MPFTTKLLIYLLSFGILDLMVPLPLVTFFLIYVVLEKPPWFYTLVKQVYDKKR